MYCHNCGNKIKEDSKFCIGCGTEINSISNEKKDNPTISSTIKSVSFDKETKKSWIILVFIILVIFGVRSIYIEYKNQQQQTQIVLQQQKDTLEATNKQIEDIQTKAENENKKLQNQVTTLENQNSFKITSDADIIAEWKNRVAEVTCWWSYSDGTTYETDEGSATLVNITDHGLTAITNKHVITDTTSTYAPNTCLVGAYGKGARIVNYISPGDPFWAGTGDWGYIYLNNSEKPTDNGAFDEIISNHLNVCQESQVALGDQIVILGYPTIGTTNGITATEGIISGLESDYYITSAKIEHGSSGGAAILVKKDCWLGIPTSVIVGSVESLGRILKAQFVLNN